MGTKERVAMPQNFITFRNGYLFVYSLMMAGDWLQGPYVYALYQHYGYSTGDIGKLFIAGFGSSMIFGTVVGSMADKYGRKNAALTYVVTYILSCITKHWSDYGVLMLVAFGGIATSLLFTAFESWLVAEHFKRGYEAEWLDKTFAKAIFLGNGLVSIVSGLLANYLVTDMSLGPVAPSTPPPSSWQSAASSSSSLGPRTRATDPITPLCSRVCDRRTRRSRTTSASSISAPCRAF